ncbi:hypothetical protein F4861DRAFT_103034 [Xylaria intraflava]|nr:hypothetical protein F4861DRAFT_103034 [Xylaria intraflava]
MTTVKFNNNLLIIKVNKVITYFDFGVKGAEHAANNTTVGPVTGVSTRVIVHYQDDNPPPREYKYLKDISFTPGAPITLTGGGSNEIRFEGVDAVKNRITGVLVGATTD